MGDGSHDLSHILRVWRNVQQISDREGGDRTILTAAVILHDCVPVPKDAADRHKASGLAAEKAAGILAWLNWTRADIERAGHAIAAHSFAANIPPQTLEARILQDADRLDAIGYVGIARCFYTAGKMGSALYHPEDPQARRRQFDDGCFALDHFNAKLLRLSGSFQTETGRAMAAARHRVVRDFADGLIREAMGIQG